MKPRVPVGRVEPAPTAFPILSAGGLSRMNGTWTRVEIAGKPADVFDPPGEQRPRFGVLFLHPVGQETLSGTPAFTSLFNELRLACVCPAGGFSWWADRICPDFDPVVT